MEVPKLEKITINMGLGDAKDNTKLMQTAVEERGLISGQKPVFTAAKKSISAFKIREGLLIGCKVTLRGQRMYDFVEKLVGITFPRVRDFRGINDKSVDRDGNMTVGFKDFSAFPEIHAEDVDNVFGLEVCLGTTAKDREKGLELFRLIGFPFKKESK